MAGDDGSTPASGHSRPGADSSHPSARREVTRRRFLGGAVIGAGVVFATVLEEKDGTAVTPLTGGGPSGIPRPAALGGSASPANVAPDFVLSGERDADLCLLDFFFYGFSVDTSTTPRAIVPTTSDNTIVVRFPPQAIGEAIYKFQNGPIEYGPTELPMDPPPVLSAMAGPSQLSFTVTLDTRIPLHTMTVADLLDWSGWQLNAPPVAQVGGSGGILPSIDPGGTGDGTPLPSRPGQLDTAIEFPYALFVAPTVYTGGLGTGMFVSAFDNRPAPLVSSAKVNDLFVSTLTRRSFFFEVPETPELSAVWARDFSSYDSPPHQFVNDVTPETNIYYGEVI